MKTLPLYSKHFTYLLEDFKDWLNILGYSSSMRENYPNYLREFFYYLESKGYKSLQGLDRQIVSTYYQHLQERPNSTRGGSLSNQFLNAHQAAIRKLNEYLKKHDAKLSLFIRIKPEKQSEQRFYHCTSEQIKLLFSATEYSHSLVRFRARNKALLVCLYSLGMRRNEVLNLQLNDILWEKEQVFVRKGKNYKERIIPINEYNLQILEDYIFDARIDFAISTESPYVFITQRSTQMSGSSLEWNLKKIVEATNNKDLIEMNITPHMLRHSIATHFLQAGMEIEDIAQFLGHSSLESTQIYTHLKHS